MTKLDFTILRDLAPSRLLFLDTSEYSSAPVSPMLHVKFPDFKKIYSTPIQYGEINIINTARLGYTDCPIEFPDGVYEIEFEVNNRACSVKQLHFRTTKAWKLLDEALENADFNNKDLLEKFNKINLYLHGAESVVKINTTQAQNLYKEALSILNCFNTDGMRMLKKHSCCQ